MQKLSFHSGVMYSWRGSAAFACSQGLKQCSAFGFAELLKLVLKALKKENCSPRTGSEGMFLNMLIIVFPAGVYNLNCKHWEKLANELFANLELDVAEVWHRRFFQALDSNI